VYIKYTSDIQTHYFSENLGAPGIEPGTSGSVARNSEIENEIWFLTL
jgi:hypothetical protein